MKTIEISDLYKLRRLSRDKRVEYVRENPEEVCDLIDFVATWILDGWMERYKRDTT